MKPTREEIDAGVRLARSNPEPGALSAVIVALADERDELLALLRDIYEWTAEGPINLSASDREKIAAMLAKSAP